MTPDHVLKHLRAGGEAGPVQSLAELLVDHALARRLDARLNAGTVVRVARLVARGWDDARLEATLLHELERSAARALELRGSVADHAPPGWLPALEAALAVPVSLDASLLMRVVDQPEIRALIQDMLQLVLGDFVKRASTPLSQNRMVTGVLSRARGMMQNSVAGGLLSAVGEGLSSEAERRVREFADEAVSMVLTRVVSQVCEARHAAAYGALRAGMVHSAAGADVTAWTRQVMALKSVPTWITLLREIRESVNAPAFETWVEQHFGLWAPEQGPTLGGWLEQAGLLNPVKDTAVTLLAEELDDVVAGDAFGAWLKALLEDAPTRKPAAKTPSRKKRA